MLCFKVQPHNDNIVRGEPYEPYSFLSYFGQTVQLSIVGESQNYSYSDKLDLNITLGQAQIFGEYPDVSGDGIHISSNAEQLGVVAEIPFGGGMAEKLGLIQPINITNFQLGNDTIELDIQGLPDGWSGTIIQEGGLSRNVSVPVNESEEVILHVQMPSYMLEVQLNYFISIEGAGDPEVEYFWEREMLYDTNLMEMFIFLLEDDELTVVENMGLLLDPQWHTGFQRIQYTLGSFSLSASDRISLSVRWENPPDFGMILLIIVVLVLGATIGYLLLRKRRAVRGEEGAEEEPEVEEPVADADSDLEQKKAKILLAIKRLEEDYKAGHIPEDVYQDLISNYKKSAIEVMKEIDGVK